MSVERRGLNDRIAVVSNSRIFWAFTVFGPHVRL